MESIRDWLETVGNLIQVGRNGLHRYNNSDHSMLTAMRAVENITTGTDHDIWAVNAESVYHEETVADEHPYKRAPETRGDARAARRRSGFLSHRTGPLDACPMARRTPWCEIEHRLEGVRIPGLRARSRRRRGRIR